MILQFLRRFGGNYSRPAEEARYENEHHPYCRPEHCDGTCENNQECKRRSEFSSRLKITLASPDLDKIQERKLMRQEASTFIFQDSGQRIPISKAYEPQKYGGETFDKNLDQKRLDTQLERVKSLLMDGEWHTVAEIHRAGKGSESACLARVRDLRKVRFGGYKIDHRRVNGSCWEYRMDRTVGK